MIGVNVLRDPLQHITQKGVLIVVPCDHGDDQIISNRLRIELDRTHIAKILELCIELSVVYIQMSFCNCVPKILRSVFRSAFR